ncbi:MAG: TonB-dependent receptor [Bacteroidaceae bacterium]|nr:TonB-dependent receptor [Bacteroidaceae bacterium]
MRFYNILFALFLTFTGICQTYAQTHAGQYTINGVVTDSITGEVQPYAAIRVKKPGSPKAFKVVNSDEYGKYSLPLTQAGEYIVECIVVGKNPWSRMLAVKTNERQSVLDIRLSDTNNTLGTATVTAQRAVVKAEVDKITYSIADDPDATTNSVLDMLRKVPMVTVDGEDKIQVNGSNSFKVYVNGKPNQMMSSDPATILKNYPASAIQKIEVITDPGAKYDAEGVAGVLNIITNDMASASGYNLAPSINFSNRGVHGSVFGMVQAGKFMLSGNYGVGVMRHPNSSSEGERTTSDDPENHLLKYFADNQDNKGLFQHGSIEGSYEFNKKNLLSFNAGIHYHKGSKTAISEYDMFRANGTQKYGYQSVSASQDKRPSYNVGADYQHMFDREGQYLTISYRYDNSPMRSKATTTYSALDSVPFMLSDLNTLQKKDFFEHTGQVDFTTPLGKMHTLSAGLKYIYRVNKSDNTEEHRTSGTTEDFVLSNDKSLQYRHQNDIAAAYLEYTLKAGNFTGRVGGRYEYSNVHVSYPDGKRDGFSSQFSDFVPSVSLGYNFSLSQILKASYSMRIGRPSIGYLSPYVDRANPTAITYGNPNLESEKAHNFNVAYNSFSPVINYGVTLSYSFSNNGLTAYKYVKDGVQHTTYDNFRKSRITTLNAFANWTITKGTSLNLKCEGNYSDFRAEQTNDHTSGFSGNVFGGLRQDLPWKLKLGIWAGGGSGRLDLQGRSGSFHFYNLNLSRSFLENDALTVTLQAGNFVNPKRSFRSTVITDTFESTDIWQTNFLRYSIGVKYNLGKLKAKVKKAARTIRNTDNVDAPSGDEQQSENGSMQ